MPRHGHISQDCYLEFLTYRSYNVSETYEKNIFDCFFISMRNALRNLVRFTLQSFYCNVFYY